MFNIPDSILAKAMNAVLAPDDRLVRVAYENLPDAADIDIEAREPLLELIKAIANAALLAEASKAGIKLPCDLAERN